MYTKRNIKFSIVWNFAWPRLLFFTIWSSAVVWLFHFFDHSNIDLTIPFLPLSTIGIAVAFYIGFKNNASYDRFWEARKIWGGIVNYSRTWALQVMSFVTLRNAAENWTENELYQEQKELIYRHLAYINALRLQLRQPSTFSLKRRKTVRSMQLDSPEKKHWDEEVGMFLNQDEYECVAQRQNTATQINFKQGQHLKKMMEQDNLIEDFRHMEMNRVLEEFYNLQGKCERIKNTPFPRQYAYFSNIFTWIFILLLPLGLVGEFAKMGHGSIILTIPFAVLISWIFLTMEMVGDNSEDPFEGFMNDVPMTALCRTIEIDLREMLKEENIPNKVRPVNDILM